MTEIYSHVITYFRPSWRYHVFAWNQASWGLSRCSYTWGYEKHRICEPLATFCYTDTLEI